MAARDPRLAARDPRLAARSRLSESNDSQGGGDNMQQQSQPGLANLLQGGAQPSDPRMQQQQQVLSFYNF